MTGGENLRNVFVVGEMTTFHQGTFREIHLHGFGKYLIRLSVRKRSLFRVANVFCECTVSNNYRNLVGVGTQEFPYVKRPTVLDHRSDGG